MTYKNKIIMQTPMMQVHADIEETVKVFGDNIPFLCAKLLLKVRDAIEDEKQIIKDAFNEGYRQGEIDGKNGVKEDDISMYGDAKNYYKETYGNISPNT